MAFDINLAAPGQYGPLKGEDWDKAATPADGGTHNDQLSIRHPQSAQNALTLIVGNQIKGINDGTGSGKYDEDIRPARVWIVPDPWGDSADTTNAAWPDWWTNASVTKGYHWGAYYTDYPKDLFKNALSVDKISNMTDKGSDSGLTASYSMTIGNRVSISGGDESGEVGCLQIYTTIEDVGLVSNRGMLGDLVGLGAYIAVRCPLNHDDIWGSSGHAKTELSPVDASVFAATQKMENNDPEGTDGSIMPKLRTYAGAYAGSAETYGYTHPNPGTGVRSSASMVRYGISYLARIMDGTGGEVQLGEGVDDMNLGYSAGFVVQESNVFRKSVNPNVDGDMHGNARIYGLLVKDVASYPYKRTTESHDPILEDGEFVGVKIDPQNVSDDSPDCDLYGIQIGDLTQGANIANGKTVRAIETNGGDVHFNGPGGTDNHVSVHFGDDSNWGRLTLGKAATSAQAIDTVGKPMLLLSGRLDRDTTSGDEHAFGGYFSPIAPNDGFVKRCMAAAAQLSTAGSASNPVLIDGTGDSFKLAGGYGFGGGVVVQDHLDVIDEAVVVGAFGYIFGNATNALVQDMAAVAAEYKNITDVDDLGTIGNAFGLYAEAPAIGGSPTAVIAAGVFDGDVAMSSDSTLYLNATPNWRSTSSMTKGSVTIGYASSQIQIHGADASVDSFFHLGSKAKASAPNGTIFIDSTDGKLYVKDNNGSLVPLT